MTRVRFKATRPVYRRGGLVLSAADWVEVEAEELSDAANVALLEDPVVLIEVSVEGDDGLQWVKFSATDRRLGVQILQAYGAGVTESEMVEAEAGAAAPQSPPADPAPADPAPADPATADPARADPAPAATSPPPPPSTPPKTPRAGSKGNKGRK